MNLKEAIDLRHSVRRYLDLPIEQEKVDKLNEIIDELNKTLDCLIRLREVIKE